MNFYDFFMLTLSSTYFFIGFFATLQVLIVLGCRVLVLDVLACTQDNSSAFYQSSTGAYLIKLTKNLTYFTNPNQSPHKHPTYYIQFKTSPMKIQKITTLLLSLLYLVVGSENLYELLEVTENATSEQLKKSFRRLSIKYHPDRNSEDPNAQAFYLKIKRAYEVLIDVSKRNTYDLFGEDGLAEIQKRPKPKGGDYRPEMPVPLSKFYEGGPMVFSFRRGEICRRCKGSGDEAGQLHKCQSCQGTGKMTRTVQVQGKSKQIQMKCNKCQGSGKAPKQVCPVCGGQKIQLKPRDLAFEVEKGMVDGDKVMFKGESEQGLQFFPGDVIVTLKQQPHAYLTRAKNDLKTSIKVSLKQAILGFERSIKQLDGRNIEIVGDYNIQDGQVIRIEGQGMPIRGQHGTFGDLLAEVSINFPKSYTNDQLREIRAIFEAGQDLGQL